MSTFIQTKQVYFGAGDDTPPYEVAYTSDVTAGSLLCLALSVYSNASLTDVTDTKGNSWTVVGPTIGDGDTHYHSWLAYAVANGSGANTVTANFASTAAYVDMTLAEYTTTSTTLDQTGTGGSGTASVRNNDPDGVIWAMGMDNSTNHDNLAVGPGGWNRRGASTSINLSHIAADLLDKAAGTYTYTPTENIHQVMILSFRPTGIQHCLQAKLDNPNNSGSYLTTRDVAFPSSLTAGNLLVASVGYCSDTDATSTPTIVDGHGNTWVALPTSVSALDGSGFFNYSRIFYCLNAVAGADTVTINIASNGAQFLAIELYEFNGEASWKLDAHAENSGLDGTQPSSGSISTAGTDVLVGVVGTRYLGTITSPGGVWSQDGVLVNFDGEHAVNTASGSYNFNPTGDALIRGWGAGIASFKVAPPATGRSWGIIIGG
jgi:hypothetical protein